MKSNLDITLDCLNRAIEVVKNTNRATKIHIEIDSDMDSVPTLIYEIEEIAPKNEEN